MSLNPLTLLEKAINEHGSAAILRERLALVADQLKNLEKENGDLQRMNADLKEEIRNLRSQLKSESIPDEFMETRGILLRRSSDGQVQEDAYCPTCKTVMFSLQGMMPFKCSKCGYLANITGNQLPKILRDIA